MTEGARVVVAGGPRTGKTTFAIELAAERGLIAKHMDDLIATHAWSEASAEVARWMSEPGPWIIEGVAAARALRKWLATHPEGKPADLICLLEEPLEPLSAGQTTMAKGCATVWREIVNELVARDVDVETLTLPRQTFA